GSVGLSVIAGPANAGKVALLLERYLAVLESGPVLIVPNRSDVERVERDLLTRSGALLGGSIGTFDDVFERIAGGARPPPGGAPPCPRRARQRGHGGAPAGALSGRARKRPGSHRPEPGGRRACRARSAGASRGAAGRLGRHARRRRRADRRRRPTAPRRRAAD